MKRDIRKSQKRQQIYLQVSAYRRESERVFRRTFVFQNTLGTLKKKAKKIKLKQ